MLYAVWKIKQKAESRREEELTTNDEEIKN